jgi:hypothetical protein
MPRPIDPNRYYEGTRCNTCGTTRRYKKSGACVECTRVANASKRRRHNDPLNPSPIIAKETVSNAVSHYYSSVAARERSARLDALIRRDDPDENKPLCGGDLHRASLPVGYTSPNTEVTYRERMAVQYVENDALRDAIRDAWASLPDCITVPAVLDHNAAIRAAVAAINPTRLPLVTSAILIGLGARQVPKSYGVRWYVVRSAMPAICRRRGRPASKTRHSTSDMAVFTMSRACDRPPDPFRARHPVTAALSPPKRQAGRTGTARGTRVPSKGPTKPLHLSNRHRVARRGVNL